MHFDQNQKGIHVGYIINVFFICKEKMSSFEFSALVNVSSSKFQSDNFFHQKFV